MERANKESMVNTLRFQPSESSSLLGNDSSCLPLLLRRYLTTHKCLTSKAALLILLWIFVAALAYRVVYPLGNYSTSTPAVLIISGIIVHAIILGFYPLAGYLADIKFGRYNTIFISLEVLVVLLGTTFVGLFISIPLGIHKNIVPGSVYFIYWYV